MAYQSIEQRGFDYRRLTTVVEGGVKGSQVSSPAQFDLSELVTHPSLVHPEDENPKFPEAASFAKLLSERLKLQGEESPTGIAEVVAIRTGEGSVAQVAFGRVLNPDCPETSPYLGVVASPAPMGDGLVRGYFIRGLEGNNGVHPIHTSSVEVIEGASARDFVNLVRALNTGIQPGLGAFGTRSLGAHIRFPQIAHL